MIHFSKALFLFLFTFSIACSVNNDSANKLVIDTEMLVNDFRTLASDEMEGRKTGTRGNLKAREYLVKRFKEEGAQAFNGSFIHEFTFTDSKTDEVNTGKNVIGVVPGKTDEVIVISAHYDHVGVKEGLIYNGADDNASGTAALIAFIDYFSQNQPEHTLVFAAFDAEEMGLQGAKAFVGNSAFLDKVVMNINMDMIAQNTKNELYASGTYHNPELKTILENTDTGDVKLLFGHDRPEQGHNDWTHSSDHGPFYAKGKKFIYFGVEDHQHYHKSTDEIKTIPIKFYEKSTRLILRAVVAFDDQL